MNNFNLFFMLKIALKHWLALVIAAVICAATIYGYFNYVAEPKYTAKGQVLVTNGTIITDAEFATEETKLQNSDIIASLNFADTVVDILRTTDIYKKLSDVTDGKFTYGELKSKTNIKRRDNNSLYIDVSFTATSPQEAIIMVNKYLDLVPEYINERIVNSSVTYEYADTSNEVYMNNISLMALAALGGAAAVYLIIFLIYSSDTVIRDEESFKDHIDLTVIGVVPDFASSKSAERKYYKYSRYGYKYGYKYGYGYGRKK